jgi:flagellar biosynthetic protein FliQ
LHQAFTCNDKVIAMTPETIMQLAQEALWVTALAAAPILLTALSVGLLVSMLQAATQVQEMTLSFIPKLVAMAIALMVVGKWMLYLLMNFTEQLYQSIPDLIG